LGKICQKGRFYDKNRGGGKGEGGKEAVRIWKFFGENVL
jgi:hypothetical protein